MRIRDDYVFGTTTAALTASGTALAGAALARLPVVAAPDIAALTLHQASTGEYEIVYVTSHTSGATTATIVRGQEGSVAKAWASGTTWLHGATALDLTAAEITTAVRAVTATTTLTGTDSVLKADATTAAVTVNLPTAVGATGRKYTVKKIDSSVNAVTVDPSGTETIDGAATVALAAQWDTLRLVSDGSNWLKV